MKPSSVVAASDAGLGLQHAFKEQNIPVAPARHNLDEMSPVKRIEGSGLQASQRKLLQRLAKHKQPAAKKVQDDFLVVGGDNKAESEVSRAKQQLRRVNQLGRVSPLMSHMTSLAGRGLLLHPGLRTILQAFKVYREDRRHAVGHAPEDFLNPRKDKDWLFP